MTNGIRVADSFRHVLFGGIHRPRQIETLGEIAGQGCGKGASGIASAAVFRSISNGASGW